MAKMFSVPRFPLVFQGALPAHYIAHAYMWVPLCVCVYVLRVFIYYLAATAYRMSW